MPEQKVAFPDELVDAALAELEHALKPGPVEPSFYVRQALEAVLPKVRERVVQKVAERTAAPAGLTLDDVYDRGRVDERTAWLFAFDAVLSQPRLGADPGIEVGGTTHIGDENDLAGRREAAVLLEIAKISHDDAMRAELEGLASRLSLPPRESDPDQKGR